MATAEADAVCSQCGGRGWILEEREGEGESRARRCECQRERFGEQLLKAAEIPPRYQACTLENFQHHHADNGERDRLLAAKRFCENYVESFLDLDSGRNRESGLLFMGPPGSGKTHLAAATLRCLIDRYKVNGRFIDCTSLIFEIQATFERDSASSKHEILRPVQEADVLVLDELGAQKPTAWVTDLLYFILNSRYTQRLPTLFTTNFRLDEDSSSPMLDRMPVASEASELLAHRIPPMLLSRLYEMAQPVRLEVADFRRTYKVHQHRL